VSKFNDNKGRPWELTVDTVMIRHVARRLDGLRIDKLHDDAARGLVELMGDPVRLVDVLWVMVEEQAKGRGVTDEDFGRAMVGDCLDAGGLAFHEALADFSPSRRREVAKALLAKEREIGAQATAKVLAEIGGITLESLTRDGAEPSKPATSAAESSASTPAPPG
jgi:hypothetical protein